MFKEINRQTNVWEEFTTKGLAFTNAAVTQSTLAGAAAPATAAAATPKPAPPRQQPSLRAPWWNNSAIKKLFAHCSFHKHDVQHSENDCFLNPKNGHLPEVKPWLLKEK
jgi:hypothetical protein